MSEAIDSSTLKPELSQRRQKNLMINSSSLSVTGSTPSTPNSTKSAGRICNFFSQGICRNGEQCRFLHETAPTNNSAQGFHRSHSNSNIKTLNRQSPSRTQTMSRSAYSMSNLQSYFDGGQQGSGHSNIAQLMGPPPVMINVQPGQPIYSVDVECVATG